MAVNKGPWYERATILNAAVVAVFTWLHLWHKKKSEAKDDVR